MAVIQYVAPLTTGQTDYGIPDEIYCLYTKLRGVPPGIRSTTKGQMASFGIVVLASVLYGPLGLRKKYGIF